MNVDGSGFLHHSVCAKKYQRSYDRNQKAAHIEAAHLAVSHGIGNKTSNYGARNADQNGHDHSTRILSWHDELGQCAGDQSKDDPLQDSHRLLL